MIPRRSVIDAIDRDTPVLNKLSPTAQKNISDRMEQWFADTEKYIYPNNTGTNSHLATQFLASFGLKNASEVFHFLKTVGGKATLTMIAREIMKEESRIESIRERNAEEMLKQQRHLVFLLMGIIAERQELAKNVDQLIRLEIDKHLVKHPEYNIETVSERVPIQILEDMIAHYVETIKVLDEKLDELEYQLKQVEEELAIIEEEERRMEVYHEELRTHIDILDTYLQLPIPDRSQGLQENPTVFSEQRIPVLEEDLERYKKQEELYKNTVSDNIQTQEVEKRRLSRHIRVTEHELNLHKDQLKLRTRTPEEFIRKALEKTRAQIQDYQPIPGQLDPELEGLKLREKGLVHALGVMSSNSILLNEKLERVFILSQARFSIKPEDAKRLIQRGERSYALIPKGKEPNDLTEDEWVQAELEFEQVKKSIQTPRFNKLDKIEEKKQRFSQRKAEPEHLKELLQTQQLELQGAKKEMGETLRQIRARKTLLLHQSTRYSHTSTPKPETIQSKSQMVEQFESLILKAPKKEEIEKIRDMVDHSSISPENKGELNKLIEQVAPEKVMGSQQRLRFFKEVKHLISETSPSSHVDSTVQKKD
ncbi:Uncharacterised protein [Legionella steigerwaltii]|uniref:LidA long coiled-coil domain-containing protein n=1 Tax=Legionella steigerwaltii TaxID=460 RepID=A0A378LCW0_9GAMM|nr:hypothetical protein [Legionella steigerwaltii]KTD78989.1 hypothetical protein Lstg_0946 [Legionella steigerwaltii]STY23579.1 Uncharacterised protein [Legionella steigerwaltii]